MLLKADEQIQSSQRTLLTIALYILFFSYGAATSVYPTAMAEYVILIASNVKDFSSIALVAQAIAYCISALIGSSIAKYVDRQIYLVLSIVILTACQIWMPYTINLSQSTICLSVTGFGQAFVDIAANAWLLAIWRNSDRAQSCLLGLHFSYALGGTVAPLFTEPFLALSLKRPNIINPDDIGNLSINRTISKNELASITQIHYPFFISAGLYFITIIIFAIIHMINPYDETNEKLQEGKNMKNNQLVSSSKYVRHIILILGSSIMMLIVGAEVSTFDFNAIFVISSGFDQHRAAFISSAKSICFAISPAVAAIVALKVPIRIIIYTSIFISLIGNFILLHASSYADNDQDNKTKEFYLYLGFSFIGLGFGPLYPAIFGFIETYATLDTFICAIFVFVGSLSTVLDFIVVGKFIEYQPNILIYYNLISVFGIAIFCLVMDNIVRTRNAILNGYEPLLPSDKNCT